MLRVILFRHAKSSWANANLSDFERSLAKRGIDDIPKIANFLKESNLLPDIITCSTSKRTRMTHSLFIKTIKKDIKTIFEDIIYEGDDEDIIDIISQTSSKYNSHMIIGHNPDMETLVEELTGKEFPYSKFSTASIAVIDFKTDKWEDILELKGKLTLFMSPKMLKH